MHLFFYLTALLLGHSFTVTCSVCPSVYEYSSWMGDLYSLTLNASLSNPAYSVDTAWPNRTLNQIMIGGSHDSGMFTITQKSGLGVFLPDNLFITQSRSFLEQLCAGSRWYDVRFSKSTGSWLIFHAPSSGIPLAAYSVDVYTTMTQFITFLNDPKNSREIIFWRIKLAVGSNSDELAGILRGSLSPYMVDNHTGNTSLPTLTLDQIWKQNFTTGKIVLMAYSWIPPSVEPGQNLGWIWDYPTNQMGEYSDTLTMRGMLTKCVAGQFPKLVQFKQTLNNTAHPLIGIWLTFTTEDVRANTALQWSLYPNAFNDFYVVNKGEIGNVILIDFFGDHPQQFMNYIWDYNFNKYASFPPLDPTNGYTVLNNPPLPGTEFLTNPAAACDSSDNATQNWTIKIVAVFVVVVILIFVICCVLPCVIYFKIKKKRDSRASTVSTELLDPHT